MKREFKSEVRVRLEVGSDSERMVSFLRKLISDAKAAQSTARARQKVA
jgi:hypothetical protein